MKPLPEENRVLEEGRSAEQRGKSCRSPDLARAGACERLTEAAPRWPAAPALGTDLVHRAFGTFRASRETRDSVLETVLRECCP